MTSVEHLFIFAIGVFGEVSVQSFLHLKNVLLILLLNFESLLFIYQIQILYQIYDLQIFPPNLVTYLFILLTVSFK